MSEEIRFVNRLQELKALRDWCSKQRDVPLYIYGPEGCGKTRLLKEFVRKFNNYFGEKAIAIYIDALERVSLEKALLTSKTVEIAKEVIEKFINKFTNKGFGIGRILADAISVILEKALIKRKLKDNYVLVAIDDVTRAIGLDQIEWYVKWLYELLWKLAEEYKPRAINFIVTTSEGQSLDLVSKHRHAHIRLIWNLSKQSFRELFYELKPKKGVNLENTWRLFGGNPGKLVELAKQFEWNLEEMKEHYRKLFHPFVLKLWKEDLIKDLVNVLNDIDIFFSKPSASKGKLQEILIERNLIIYKNMTTIHKIEIPPDPEISVGKYFAWQVPLYRELLREIISESISST